MNQPGPQYQGEPGLPWWSPWRKWVRRGLALLPLALMVAALTSTLLFFGDILARPEAPTLIAAIIGGLIAVFGSLGVQYLALVIERWRADRERARDEIATLTVLMMELGEAAVRMKLNAQLVTAAQAGQQNALTEVRPAEIAGWDALKYPMSRLWAPKSVMQIADAYVQLRLMNAEIAKGAPRMLSPDFPGLLAGVAVAALTQIKVMERRTLRIGRE